MFSFLNPFEINPFSDRKNEKNFSQCIYPEDNDSCKSSMKRRESYERDDWRMKEDTEMISIQFRNL